MTTTPLLKTVLIVDDEPDICQLAEITLSRMGLDTRSANDVNSAKLLLSHSSFDLCLTDMNLPDGTGIDLIEHIQSNYPNIPVAVITAHGNMESAVRSLKAGAFDFVSKPIDLDVLRKLVGAAIKLSSRDTSTISSSKEQSLLGDSKIMQQLRARIAKLARSQAPVFIHGESGCGKELAARNIHSQGARNDGAFVAVNCGAIPTELMESEFFGHKKGSFTGANTDKEGLFDTANGGTLFLDEIADLPLHMQVKLLRAIQEKSIRPIGDQNEHSVDVRILSASHKNLKTLVSNNEFREDLYYRVNVIELSIPSLRERKADIPVLAEFLLLKLANKSAMDKPPIISDEALQALARHNYPGNVRELENILERALALCENNIIEQEDLQLSSPIEAAEKTDPSTNPENLTAPNASEQSQTPTMTLADQERKAIIEALERNRWNKTAAAKQLGMTLRQLRYRIERMGIE